MPEPIRMRIKLDGDVADVRVLIGHPMETGLRKDPSTGELVPLHFINAEQSPAVKLSGAIVTHLMTELEIACLPSNLPQYIEVNLGNMLAGSILHLSDITLPVGVTFVSHGGDANPALASAYVKAGSDAADEAAPAAAPAADKPAE